MKIGIIGAGNVGTAAAEQFVKAGHEVALSNSRGPATLGDLVARLGAHAHAMTIEEAAQFGDIVLIAVPFGKSRALPAAWFAGKIVIDANNYFPDRDGKVVELDNGTMTSSELTQQHLPGARIVKAFNTIWSEHLRTQGNAALPSAERRAIFVAGDDAEAKQIVSDLIEQIGFAAVDMGSLRDGGRLQQPGGNLFNKDLKAGQL
jgi:8-hydroxy-5-deazaflavin:NADPH oxidoreductase